MKIGPATNHSSGKIDYNHFFPQNAELILSRGDRICSPVYFAIPNSAYFF